MVETHVVQSLCHQREPQLPLAVDQHHYELPRRILAVGAEATLIGLRVRAPTLATNAIHHQRSQNSLQGFSTRFANYVFSTKICPCKTDVAGYTVRPQQQLAFDLILPREQHQADAQLNGKRKPYFSLPYRYTVTCVCFCQTMRPEFSPKQARPDSF